MIELPFYDNIVNYVKTNPKRFHVPGHKGRLGKIFENISQFDVTELPQTDNLFDPSVHLLESEAAAARLFGYRRVVFSAGGATLGNQTILSFFAGKKVIFDRNIHISVFYATILLDITPIFVYNGCSDGNFSAISTQAIFDTIKKNPDAAAVFITSPNYYGNCADCENLRNICDRNGIKLLVDNAHGSHLQFFWKNNYAHMTVFSAHKTLPVLTGGAFICFEDEIERSEISAKMLLFSSTSPSFLTLMSLDYACGWCQDADNLQLFHNIAKKVDVTKNNLVKNGVKILTSEKSDPLKLCISLKNPDDLHEKLLINNISYELFDGTNFLFMFSPFNTDEEIELLENTILSSDFTNPSQNIQTIPKTGFSLNPKDAIFSQCREISVTESSNNVAARPVITYPPGVPLLLPGELITDEIVGFLLNLGIKKVKIV